MDCGGCEFFWCKMFVKSLFTFIYAVHWNLKFSEISEILLRYCDMSFYLNARLALYMEIGQQMLLNGVNFELLMTSRSSVIE